MSADLPHFETIKGSSNVAGVAKVGDHLWVKYHDGGVYRFSGQGHHHAPLMAADSKGKYLHGLGIKGERIP